MGRSCGANSLLGSAPGSGSGCPCTLSVLRVSCTLTVLRVGAVLLHYVWNFLTFSTISSFLFGTHDNPGTPPSGAAQPRPAWGGALGVRAFPHIR